MTAQAYEHEIEDSDDEEYSPSKRQKIIVDFLTDIVNKNIDIEIETDDSEDEYDKEFEELENSNEIDSNDINLDYFKKLKLHQKKLIIKNIKDINVINENSIPIKFKVLESNANILTKSIAMQQIDKITDMDQSSGEYSKTEQWISGLIKIPFNCFLLLYFTV